MSGFRSFDDNFSICKVAYVYWPGQDEASTRVVGLFCTIQGIFQFIAFIYILLFLRHQRRKISRGDLDEMEATKTLIFPMYVKVITALAFACIYQAIIDPLVPVDIYNVRLLYFHHYA